MPGWYFIETNTPIAVFEKLIAQPKGIGHYDMPGRIKYNKYMINERLAILPVESGALYYVYSGEHNNLKSRAREHTRGHARTGCLCLSQYPELAEYIWNFKCISAPNANNKALRVYFEQKWRGANGWPILCKE